MPKNSVLIIAAAGSGSRMGLDVPKQFYRLAGVPIIVRTLRAFDKIPFKETLVLVSKECEKLTRDILKEFNISAAVLLGGETRNDTILKAVRYLKDSGRLDSETILVTHDSVRPFVTTELALDCIKAAREHGAATAAIPATDTIVLADDFIKGCLDRSRLWQVQTPQAFYAERFSELLCSLSDSERKAATDCTSLYTQAGEKVALVKGLRENIKLTYKSDLKYAEYLILDK